MAKLFYLILSLLVLSAVSIQAAEENFLLINGSTGEVLMEIGPHIHKRVTPCSTFKIPLSLMGYDAEILEDENTPFWSFQDGYYYLDYKETWKADQSPESWMKDSCVWYSQVLAKQLGLDSIQHYLKIFEYGNQDMTGGLTDAWLESSLKISPQEQVTFLQKFLNKEFSLSDHSLDMTKRLLFKETLEGDRKLFGKTGFGSLDNKEPERKIGWFIGWVESNQDILIFAYHIQGTNIDPAKRVPRVIQLLSNYTY